MQLLGLNFPRDKFKKREQTMRLYTTIYSCMINARAAAFVSLQFFFYRKNGHESLKLVSKMGFLTNGTRISVWNIPSGKKDFLFRTFCSSRKFSTGMTSYSSFSKEGDGVGGAGATFKILFQEGGDWYLMLLWASCLPNNNRNRKFDVSLVGALVSHQEWLLVSYNESECLRFNSCCA